MIFLASASESGCLEWDNTDFILESLALPTNGILSASDATSFRAFIRIALAFFSFVRMVVVVDAAVEARSSYPSSKSFNPSSPVGY